MAAQRAAQATEPGADAAEGAPGAGEHGLPPAPPPASTLRIAFVGQAVFFRQCALEDPLDGLSPEFIDFRSGVPPAPLLARLEELDPDVVLVFRPEIVPAGLFAPLRALTIGYLTEPLPRRRGRVHHDLRARMGSLQAVDPANFDRIVCFDPLIAQTASSVLPVWRSAPIPVADSVFMDARPRSSPPRCLFVGRSSEHRERMLAPVRSAYPLVHIGHGLTGEPLLRFLGEADVQLNLHNNAYPTFENRVCLALAAGHLVISEPLSPDHGLIAGEHYLEVSEPGELVALLGELARDPGAYTHVQAAGRAQAERFRASRVYPELIRAALADAAARGGRHGGPHTGAASSS
jgi:hypothetical protein